MSTSDPEHPRSSSALVPASAGVQSVLSALDVLDCFADDDELGVTEIAERIGVAKSTAHRLLTSLCARGMTERLPDTGRYRLGLHLYELGQLAQDRLQVRHLALPVLEELRMTTGQTVHLAAGDGADVVFLERLQTLRGIPLLGERHRRMPLHSTSVGKVLAAFDATLAAAREQAGLPALTDRTITSVPVWRATLIDVRRRGFAVADAENRPGLASVAVPIRDRSGRVATAVSLAGPPEQIVPRADNYARALHAAAVRIGQRLGA